MLEETRGEGNKSVFLFLLIFFSFWRLECFIEGGGVGLLGGAAPLGFRRKDLTRYAHVGI